MATMSKCLQLVDRISDQDRDEILRRIDGLRATEMPPEVAQVRAVMDALEAAQREAVTSSPAFKEWFGSSKVVDEDGKPKVLYHGTAGDFSTFIPGGLEPTMSGPAIWLSPDADHQPAAHNIGGRGRYRDGVNVMPVYARMERPLTIDDQSSLEWAREVFAGGSMDFPQVMPASWANEVTRDGEYDGIIFDGEALGWGKGTTEYILFDPRQVKSAIGNNGQFSRQNPDIRLSQERTPKKNFGRIVPYAQEAYKKLSPKAANAVDSWNVNWSNGQLEMAFRNGTPLADEIRAAFEPVREQLRKVFGDTITLYRGERTSPLDDEKRTLLSWTPVRSLAKMFAVGREGDPLSDKEIEDAVAQYERIGFAQVRGNRFLRNKNSPEFFDIYNRNRQPVTDGADLGRMLRDDQREQLEDAAERRQGKSLYTAEVPVDDIVWIPLGANLTQPEMIATYNPRTRDAESLKFSASRDQTETPEFKRWFGNSAAVVAVNAETGRPVVSSKEPKRVVPQLMYHTTRNDFSAFEIGRSTRNSGTFGDWDTKRHAIFVTPEIEASQAYGTAGGRFASGANVMPLYIKAENPLDLTDGISEDDAAKLEASGMSPRFIYNGLGNWAMFDDEEGQAVVDSIKAAGFDSVVFNDENPDTGESFEAWALFDPTQIKSAIGNRGTFDPTNPDIRFSPSRDQTETPEFKRWFDGSKVVDSSGKPMVVYHGSPQAGFEEFDVSNVGAFFSDRRDVASTYAGRSDDVEFAPADAEFYDEAPGIYDAYLSLKNPMVMDWGGKDWGDGPEGLRLDDWAARAKRQGFDGLIVEDVVDTGWRAPGLANDSEPSMVYVAFRPEQIKSATNNRGTFDPTNPDIRFSTSRLDAIRDMQLPAGYRVADLLDSSKKVSWWDKSVGTMYHLAEKHPAFKRVYDAIQNFIGDVSTYATRAADMAPSILPKLEYMRDIFKSPVAPEDVKALAGPIFEGTLRYTRDQNGNAVETQDVGLAGVVWREDELRGKWKLNDRQIGLYREFRRATNKSISDLAITDMLRYAGDDAAGVRAQALRANGVRHARDIIVEELMKMAAANPNRAQLLGESIQVIKEKANSAMGLIAKGYAPLSRYGDYTVYVTQGDEQIYFGMFETQREANKMARQMREQHPNADVATGTMSKESYKLFSGVSPETLALFGEAMGLEDSATDEQKQVFDRYLKLAKSNRSTMKRLIERKGIDGFSEDFGRVLAGFVYSNARQASTNLHAGEIGRSVYAIKQGGPQNGDLLDQAVKLMQYVQNGQEEAQAIRGLLFAQYIGGSLASAMTNLTQSLTTTWPTLSMHFGIGNSGRALTDALRIVKSNGAGDPIMQAALKRAEEEGITAPQEVHHLMAQAAGRGSLQTGDGTKVGDTLAKISNTAAKVQFAWGKAFGWAEQLNRKVAFAAAFSLARDKGMPDPFGFATKIVFETQYVMNKGNNPNWARGAVGATLFTFKKFMVNYLEGLARMWGNGPEGKKAFALSLAILWMLAGFGGMPGGEDLDDLIDAFAQRVLDKNFSTKQAKKEFFTEIFGKAGADFVMSGFSGLPGVPLDVSGRLGLGNIVPGTGILTKKADHSSDVKEIGGAAADFVSRMLTGVGQVAQGDFSNAVQSFAPVAAGNAYKAMEMARLGYYKDQKNRKVVDTDLADAVLKGVGFQPRAVAQVQEAVRGQQQLIALNKLRETEIADLWTRGRVERNPEMVENAKRQLEEWNRDNPDSPIEIDASQINRRVREANMSKAQRIAKSAPKEIRKAVEERLRSIE